MQNTTTCSKDKKVKYTKTLKIPVYECEVQFVITNQLISKLVNAQYKKYRCDETFDGEAEGCLFSPNMKLYIMFLNTDHVTHNTIAHELYHLVSRMTTDRDIEDDEQQAWLCGWVTEQFYKFLAKKNLTVR